MPRRTALLTALLLATAAPASAASRLVISMAEAANVYIDDQLVHAAPAGPRVTATVQAGLHTIELTDTKNESIFLTQLQVPDNAEVKASFARGSGLVVVGPEGSVVAPGGAGLSTPDDGTDPDTEVESTFDMNEGTPNPQRETEDRYAGNYQAWQDTTSTVGRGVGTATNISNPVTRTVPAAASGVSTMVRTADAGGTDALRRSSGGNSWRQGRPIPPAAKKGKVELEHTGDAPLTIYIDGFEVAQLSQAGSGTIELEVGAHELSIWNAATNTELWKGRIKMEENIVLPLVFSESSQPQATDRAWLYSNR